jgi:hypothetical protein
MMRTGLPDGLFSNQQSQFGKILEGLAMLVYFMTIWSILWPLEIFYMWPFGIFCGNLVFFPRFGILDQEKSGNTGCESSCKRKVLKLK